MTTASTAPMTEKITRYLALADEVFRIADSGATAETKYDLIFSNELSHALADLFKLDYYDPDTSYEDDIAAYVGALRAKCDDLRQIVLSCPRCQDSGVLKYATTGGEPFAALFCDCPAGEARR